MLGLADLLYPQACLECGRLVRGGLCRDCIGNMPRLGPAVCSFCGAPSEAPVGVCVDCRGRGHRFDSARQAVEFGETVRTAVHRFKYCSERSLAGPLAFLLEELVAGDFAGAVTWVPGQADRVRRRGFDHGELLARTVAERAGLAAVGMLKRVRRTAPQMSLEPAVRRKNLVGAFAVRGQASAEILVVDDVFTTGATASEAARALKAAGAERVRVICIARAIPRR